MSEIRFGRNCVFCGKRNSRHSRHGRTFKCKFCGEVNFGPGLARANARALELASEIMTEPSKGRHMDKPKVDKPAKSAPKTIIKSAATKTPSPPQQAPVQTPAPAPEKKRGFASVMWG